MCKFFLLAIQIYYCMKYLENALQCLQQQLSVQCIPPASLISMLKKRVCAPFRCLRAYIIIENNNNLQVIIRYHYLHEKWNIVPVNSTIIYLFMCTETVLFFFVRFTSFLFLLFSIRQFWRPFCYFTVFSSAYRNARVNQLHESFLHLFLVRFLHLHFTQHLIQAWESNVLLSMWQLHNEITMQFYIHGSNFTTYQLLGSFILQRVMLSKQYVVNVMLNHISLSSSHSRSDCYRKQKKT